MLAALHLARSGHNRVLIVEVGKELGGTYGSRELSNGSLVDHGMHVLYDTGIPLIDKLIEEPLQEHEWNIYYGNDKDVAGAFFNGTLQRGSPYPDLRNLDNGALSAEVRAEINDLLAAQASANYSNAREFCLSYFGETASRRVLFPVLKKLYKCPPECLDVSALAITDLFRLVLEDKPSLANPGIRRRVAVPNQMTLPLRYKSTQRALYPKSFGLRGYIERLKLLLDDNEVEVLMQSRVTSLVVTNNRVTKLSISAEDDREIEIDSVHSIFWTAGYSALTNALSHHPPKPFSAQMLYPYYVYADLKAPPDMKPLYYFYVYDEGFSTFRLTHYNSYCPSLSDASRNAIAIEMWLEEPTDKTQLRELAFRELMMLNIVKTEADTDFIEIVPASAPFFVPSLSNASAIESMRGTIRDQGIDNLIVAGPQSERGLAFLPEVLRDAFQKLRGHYFS